MSTEEKKTRRRLFDRKRVAFYLLLVGAVVAVLTYLEKYPQDVELCLVVTNIRHGPNGQLTIRQMKSLHLAITREGKPIAKADRFFDASGSPPVVKFPLRLARGSYQVSVQFTFHTESSDGTLAVRKGFDVGKSSKVVLHFGD